MSQIGTGARQSLVAIAPRSASAGQYRSAPRAAFLSQLIAERQQMSIQRARRRAPLGVALNTYDAGGRLSEKRMPAGYRLDIDA